MARSPTRGEADPEKSSPPPLLHPPQQLPSRPIRTISLFFPLPLQTSSHPYTHSYSTFALFHSPIPLPLTIFPLFSPSYPPSPHLLLNPTILNFRFSLYSSSPPFLSSLHLFPPSAATLLASFANYNSSHSTPSTLHCPPSYSYLHPHLTTYPYYHFLLTVPSHTSVFIVLRAASCTRSLLRSVFALITYARTTS
jgi:hypothetical protein